MDSDISTWPYYRDRYGIEGAAEQYFPVLFANDDQLRIALAQIKNCKLAIEAHIAQIAAAEG